MLRRSLALGCLTLACLTGCPGANDTSSETASEGATDTDASGALRAYEGLVRDGRRAPPLRGHVGRLRLRACRRRGLLAKAACGVRGGRGLTWGHAVESRRSRRKVLGQQQDETSVFCVLRARGAPARSTESSSV